MRKSRPKDLKSRNLTPEELQKESNLRRNRREKIKERMVIYNKELSNKPLEKVVRQFLKNAKEFIKGKTSIKVTLIDDYKWLGRKLGKI